MSDIKATDIFNYKNLISLPVSSRTLFDSLLEWLIATKVGIYAARQNYITLPLTSYAKGLAIPNMKEAVKQAKEDAEVLIKLTLRPKGKRNLIRPFGIIEVKNDGLSFEFEQAFLTAIEKYLQKTKKEA